ncbi:MAG: hypothetical protein KGI38_10885 [Thaumarchaeota archaeon]|nr:hypothetical protein [Nitrososphaerota archaeon]
MREWAKRHQFSRRFKTILALFLLGATLAASATTYAYFYASTTATVRTADLTLAAGTDSSSCTTVYPCATVTISGTSDTATVTLSLFKADSTFSPPPATYYTNLVQVKDAANAHSVISVSITSISSTSASDFGKIIVYYCTAQCTFDSSGAVNGGTSVGSFLITSTGGGSVSGTFPQSISASGTHFIEVVAYAGSTALTGDTISFKVAVQWV